MFDGTETDIPMPTAEEIAAAAEIARVEAEKAQQGQAITQADVDRIVKERLAQQAKNQFGDYAELKAKAEGAKTLEDRFAALEGELSNTKADALRAGIAATFGISTKKGEKGEPSDADLFLTGTDETALTAQATRLAGREADRKAQGNVAPKEGETKNSGNTDSDLRTFTQGLFGNAN
jgi:hypothetical protein